MVNIKSENTYFVMNDKTEMCVQKKHQQKNVLCVPIGHLFDVRFLDCEPNNQLNVYTTSDTEGEVGPVKLV